ncbi:MAG: hypothetical protein COW00_06710 [Bdellovibrio sp. CG12_big_fil_rev_8_21_14_0_65_39_13]|nr:MAG: hypothetical protein COW78_04205 [Bdellovibrio sp. CG22_combo_CG10-13_8_21_14_all_39_27]PIQ60443.1 MAG: hypothetical protein COW00_06710 [Bdellovibrio sp. CG12_big_fil_rev_8_21_14_0_65_39_13]PIR34966.1 MAG: hypothetical protein COV37_11010 [Bdellovibrio sp. CG11_big_fil_rev_8_21_14_0_20_39_38]
MSKLILLICTALLFSSCGSKNEQLYNDTLSGTSAQAQSVSRASCLQNALMAFSNDGQCLSYFNFGSKDSVRSFVTINGASGIRLSQVNVQALIDIEKDYNFNPDFRIYYVKMVGNTITVKQTNHTTHIYVINDFYTTEDLIDAFKNMYLINSVADESVEQL